MTLQDLQNIQVFLKRVPMTGEEAIGWCQAWAAVQAEVVTVSKPASVPSEPSA